MRKNHPVDEKADRRPQEEIQLVRTLSDNKTGGKLVDQCRQRRRVGEGMVELGLGMMGRLRFVPTRFSSSATPEPGKRLSFAGVSGITSAGITGLDIKFGQQISQSERDFFSLSLLELSISTLAGH